MSYTKEEAHEQFRKWSVSYDRSVLQRIFFAPAHKLLLRHLDGILRSLGRQARLLDVGCGTGTLAQRLADRRFAGDCVGLDFCGPMLGHAVHRPLPARQYGWVQGDSQRLPFADASFDVITCVHSFHHYPQQRRAISEMFRVLAPGGQAIILDAYKDGLWGGILYDRIVVAIEGGVHHPSREQFGDWFSAAGFGGIRQEVLGGVAPMLLTRGCVRARVGGFVRIDEAEGAVRPAGGTTQNRRLAGSMDTPHGPWVGMEARTRR